MVGEGAVGREVQRHQLEIQTGRHEAELEPTHAVAGVRDDLELAAEVRLADDHVDIGLGEVAAAQRAFVPGLGEVAATDARLHRPDALLAAQRHGLLAAQLEADVLGRVVAGGDHDAAVEVAVADAKAMHRCRAKATVDHVDPRRTQAGHQRVAHAPGRGPQRVAPQDPLGLDLRGVGAADLVSQVGVDLRSVQTPDVVGFKDAHACIPPPAPSSVPAARGPYRVRREYLL